MDAKREERKQRSEQQKEEAQRRQVQTVRTRRFLLVAVVLGVAAFIFAARSRQAPAGKVWSAEHGHWHDE